MEKFVVKISAFLASIWKSWYQVGREDPRRAVHAVKVGVALTLVSFLYIFDPLFHRFGNNAMWAVMTVLVVLEFAAACVSLYFHNQEKDGSTVDVESTKEMISEGYQLILDSKSSDVTLAMFASWEPRHLRHCYRYPWQQYVKLGTALRHFGYSAVSLYGCLESEIQTPPSVRRLFRDPCIRVATEVSKVLLDLSSCIRSHCQCSPDIFSDHLHQALHDLNSAISSLPCPFLNSKNVQSTAKHAINSNSMVTLPLAKSDVDALVENKNNKNDTRVGDQPVLRPTLSKIDMLSLEFSEALPFAAFAALLVEMTARLELVIEEVEELGRKFGFKEFEGDLVSIEVRQNETKENVKIGDLHSHGVLPTAE
ncbi:hypothetical protein LUZ63_010215 [Rhynchospora breviuscula]|uniref:Aluminum-activated malate transporter n=1 Tax=Rhynchospora breviuscula TaxID=2022672 RepID=A0A9Q0CGZ8_9POAL|nr:hypothetical protein LUZ63_010215 [Rhynchospora breviuscula]